MIESSLLLNRKSVGVRDRGDILRIQSADHDHPSSLCCESGATGLLGGDLRSCQPGNHFAGHGSSKLGSGGQIRRYLPHRSHRRLEPAGFTGGLSCAKDLCHREILTDLCLSSCCEDLGKCHFQTRFNPSKHWLSSTHKCGGAGYLTAASLHSKKFCFGKYPSWQGCSSWKSCARHCSTSLASVINRCHFVSNCCKFHYLACCSCYSSGWNCLLGHS